MNREKITDMNSMCYWWPKIKDLGIPVPRTIEVKTSLPWLFGVILTIEQNDKVKKADIEEIKRLNREMIASGESIGQGGPVFLRTDALSGKHEWKNSCFVRDIDNIMKNVFRIAEEQELMTMGFVPIKSLFVREYIPMKTAFRAFHGDMPVNKERRYFIRDGKVECHHPYWPEKSIHGFSLPEDWKSKLAELNHEDEKEIEVLTLYAEIVGKHFPEWWSVDFSCAENGTWYLIDMARGEDSFHWTSCQHVPEDQRGQYPSE